MSGEEIPYEATCEAELAPRLSTRRRTSSSKCSGSRGFIRNVTFRPRVLLLCLRQPADHQHRQPGMGLAKSPHEIRATHPRHQVVRNHQPDLTREISALKLLQSTSRVQRRNHEVPRTLQNRLPCCRLYSVIVDKKKSSRHKWCHWLQWKRCSTAHLGLFHQLLCRRTSNVSD